MLLFSELYIKVYNSCVWQKFTEAHDTIIEDQMETSEPLDMRIFYSCWLYMMPVVN
jgi:hypothetical protein